MRFKLVLVCVFSTALLMCASMTAFATPPSNTQQMELEAVRNLYYDSLTNAAAVDRGLALARASEEIVHHLRIAYEGSFLCLQARDSLWPLRKWNRAQEGLELLDKAVQISPESVEVRVLRAAVTAHLPSFFGRSAQAEKDLDWLEQIKSTEQFNTLTPKLQKFVHNFMKTVKRG